MNGGKIALSPLTPLRPDFKRILLVFSALSTCDTLVFSVTNNVEFFTAISQSYISQWLAQPQDISGQKKKAMYTWYLIEKRKPPGIGGTYAAVLPAAVVYIVVIHSAPEIHRMSSLATTQMACLDLRNNLIVEALCFR